MVVVHQLIRAYGLAPGIILQLGKALAGCLGVIARVAHYIFMNIQRAFPAAIALFRDLLQALTAGINMALLIFQLAIA